MHSQLVILTQYLHNYALHLYASYVHTLYQLEFVSVFVRGKLHETRRDRDFFYMLIEYAYEKINRSSEDTMTLMATKANWTLQQYIQLTDILFNDNNLNVSSH
jgi:hypothetical protein